MDPDVTLSNIRELCNRLKSQCYSEAEEITIDPSDAESLVELFAALDEWIKNGGFLPASWQKK